jgi:hypothetical protein
MTDFPTECIIIGGGPSIKPYISSLQTVCANKFTILTNYAFKTFPGTFLAFTDRDLYHPKPDIDGKLPNPDCYDELKKLPLIIGINHNGVEEFKLDNTILLPKEEKEVLTGIFALKLAIRLMETGTVYLLGYDWSRRKGLPERDPNYNPKSSLPTHYYENINHRGIGYVGYYENHNPDKDFSKLIKKDTLKIYNVSPDSNINCFEKIDYAQFFRLLSNKIDPQEELRNTIRTKFSCNKS